MRVAEYRIDDLARMAGTTVRNVRVYQDRGLLAPPRRVGRVGWYSEAQLARLRLIGRLLERGFTLALIAELISAWEQGRDLADILGVEEVLTQPWSTEVPERVTLRRAAPPLRAAGEHRAPSGGRSSSGLLRRVRAVVHRAEPAAAVGGRGAGRTRRAAGRRCSTSPRRWRRTSTSPPGASSRWSSSSVLGDAAEATLPPQERLSAIADIVQRLRPQASIAVEASFAVAMERQVAAAFSEIAGRTVHLAAGAPVRPTGQPGAG